METISAQDRNSTERGAYNKLLYMRFFKFLTLKFQKVKLVVNRKREGLIRARIRAAMVATGDTFTFLDSHVEVNQLWIEPLMSRIKANPRMVVAPIIDVINKDNFNYIGADAFLTGGVSWAMVFRWDWMTRREMETMDHRVGLKSPTIAGGLFSIGKIQFLRITKIDFGILKSFLKKINIYNYKKNQL